MSAARKVRLTMASVGTHKLFEDAGFTLAPETDAACGGFPRVQMRRGPALNLVRR